MFGYVKPNLPELKVREKERYEAWYCGLCRSLGKRYGQKARLLLSYDCAFLAMFLSSVRGEASPCEKHLCPVHPLRGKKPMVRRENPAFDYAADICVILAKFKLRDDVRDGKPLRRTLSLPLLRAFSKAKKRLPEVYAAVEKSVTELAAIEKAKLPSPDSAANTSGEMLRAIMVNAPLPEDLPAPGEIRLILSEIGFFIGRTVYLLDAWDDREKDLKKKLYNPFNLSGAKEEDAEFLVNFSINSAISAYNLLEERLRSDLGVLHNVFYEGLFNAWDGINRKAFARKKKKGTATNNERTDKAK